MIEEYHEDTPRALVELRAPRGGYVTAYVGLIRGSLSKEIHRTDAYKRLVARDRKVFDETCHDVLLSRVHPPNVWPKDLKVNLCDR